jgi:Ca2+-binding EF-hand superfamily protein
MGSSYSIAVPDRHVKGMGGPGDANFEIVASGFSGSLKSSYKIYVYEHEKEKTCKPYIIDCVSSGSGATTFTIPGRQLTVGKSYFVKLWDGNGYWANVLATSEPFRVVDFEMVLSEKLESQSKAQMAALSKASQVKQVKDEQEQEMKAKVEAAKAACSALTRNEKQVLRKHFDIIDADGSNDIDEDELYDYVNSNNGSITKEVIQKMVDEADADTDGGIDFNEFCGIMQKAQDFSANKQWGNIWKSIEKELEGAAERGNKKRKAPTTKKKTLSKKKK